ncbi:MAG: hypothetical protein ABIT05_07175 [Chitinophagaceae bacterium]
MTDINDLIKNWWKQILFVVLLSLLVVGTITFIKPRQYLSVATAVPASSFAADRSKIFSDNIQDLYSTLGTADDLDRIVGTGNLDTVYLAVAAQFNLFDHYKMAEKSDVALPKAAAILKKNSRVMKSEYGELKVKVWDTDKNLAPQLANMIMDKLAIIHQQLQSAGNEAALKGLVTGKVKLQGQLDSTAITADTKNALAVQLQQYEKLIGEYQLMVDSKPPVLLVVENARASAWPDRPRRMQVLIATAVLSFFFAFLAALLMESRKKTK